MWMGCRASLTAAVLDVRRMGMRYGSPPQIAIPPIRPATPRALWRSPRLLAFCLSPLCFFLVYERINGTEVLALV